MYYKVTFKWYDTNTFCTNLAHADTLDKVQQYYASKHGIENPTYITEATHSDVREAMRKGMPIVEVK